MPDDMGDRSGNWGTGMDTLPPVAGIPRGGLHHEWGGRQHTGGRAAKKYKT